jgi:hypothetical protein
MNRINGRIPNRVDGDPGKKERQRSKFNQGESQACSENSKAGLGDLEAAEDSL